MKRGEVYWVEWPGRGSEQGGRRPSVVVQESVIIQNDTGNKFAPTVIVAAITRSVKDYPVTVRLPAGEGGLKEEGCVNCAQIQTIDKSHVGEYIGKLSAKKMAEVDQALRVSFGLQTQAARVPPSKG
ncbi:MAG TPA: type II toxin-antitoxin system PemK/MazF family toxin [bacterium]|nr:type II toxin-antitoxin system PemK/MazF family toxin [bacterium]